RGFRNLFLPSPGRAFCLVSRVLTGTFTILGASHVQTESRPGCAARIGTQRLSVREPGIRPAASVSFFAGCLSMSNLFAAMNYRYVFQLWSKILSLDLGSLIKCCNENFCSTLLCFLC